METNNTLEQKIATYTPTISQLDSVRRVPLLLAVGISGAGKDTVLRKLAETYPARFTFMVSHTSRPPRINDGTPEQDGVHYYFIDLSTAQVMLDEKAFLEVNYYAGNLYGTSVAELQRAGRLHKMLISDIDVNGVANYVRLGMNVKPIFFLPPSFEAWRQRWEKRYTPGQDNADDLRKRLVTARKEMQAALSNDYYYLVINDDLEATVRLINDIASGQDAVRRPVEALDCAMRIAKAIDNAIAEG